jgi:hypothetical protein
MYHNGNGTEQEQKVDINNEFLDALFEDERFQNRLVGFIRDNMSLEVRVDNGAPFEQRDNEVRVSVKLVHREQRMFGYGEESTVLEGSDSTIVSGG